LALQLSINPFEDQLDQWLAVRQSMQLLGIADEFAVADLLLDRVQRLDLSDIFINGRRVARQERGC
jgi:hypothetical protein